MSIQSNLESAASGLLMMSESEFPFDYISTDDTSPTPAVALKITGQPEGTPVETTTVDYLLRNLTDPAIGMATPDQAKQYQGLVLTLKDSLQQLTVYRIGQVQIDTLIIGLTAEGKVAGLRTKLIET